MLNRWQVLSSQPGTVEHPRQLDDKWCAATVLDAPGTVATIQDGNPDDFDWWWRATVTAEEPISVEFAGLTFPATVFLDGEVVTECESMFLPTHFDCAAGDHEVVIRFGAMNHWLKTRRRRGRWRSTLVGTPGLRWARTTLLGRAPVYGDLPAPVGIWRPITVMPTRLCTDTVVRVAGDVITVVGSTNGTSVRMQLTSPDRAVLVDQTLTPHGGEFRFDATVPSPLRWWPNGYGPQHLYHITIETDGTAVADRLVGFRTISLSDDGFQLAINGTEIFCRGATWSPPDPIRMYADDAEIRDQIRTFAEAGATMVRVVGGLAFEQDEFWRAAAEAGLLVWQDAMLSTFDPPAEQNELVVRELTAVLQRVSGNPALAVVSGGSETLQQPELLGLSLQESTIDLVDGLLPAAVADHSDAHYVRSSPAPPATGTDLAVRPDTGVAHWFGVGGYFQPIPVVRSAGVRFAAECLAFANPPSAEFIERHFGSAAVAGHHPDWKGGVPRDRGSSWDFEDVRDFYAREVFGEDMLVVRRTDPDRYLQLGRLAVATAMRECFGFWRRGDSGCGGALVLSCRDTYPGAGWGLLDSDGGAKPALAVLTRAWAPVTVLLGNEGLAGVRIDIYNDTQTVMSGELTLTATNSAGVTVSATQRVAAPPAASVTFADADLTGRFQDLSHAFRFGPPAADAVQATVLFADGSTTTDVLVVNPRPGQSASLLTASATQKSDDLWHLELTSAVTLRYLEVNAPGWVSSDNFFHVAAGLPRTVALTRAPGSGSQSPTGTVGSIDLLARAPIRGGR